MSESKYNLHTRRDIPKDYECCWNCQYMLWSVGIGMGVRCWNKKNEYVDLTGDGRKLQLPVIPGVAKKCEYFESKHDQCQVLMAESKY